MTIIDARDNTADVVTSNILSNHVPAREMKAIVDETFRVLRPGGRASIIDVMLRKEIPENVRGAIPANCNVLKSALTAGTYESYLRDAGFENISIKDTKKDISDCLTDQQGSPVTQHQEQSGAYDGQQAPRKEEDKSGSYRRKVGKFTRGLVAGQDEKEGDVDFKEYAGVFQILARKPQ